MVIPNYSFSNTHCFHNFYSSWGCHLPVPTAAIHAQVQPDPKHPWGQILWLRSICLEYKHADLPNREYVYNKNDKDSFWQQHFAPCLISTAKLWASGLNSCPPASRDHSSAFCHNHWSHLVMLGLSHNVLCREIKIRFKTKAGNSEFTAKWIQSLYCDCVQFKTQAFSGTAWWFTYLNQKCSCLLWLVFPVLFHCVRHWNNRSSWQTENKQYTSLTAN